MPGAFAALLLALLLAAATLPGAFAAVFAALLLAAAFPGAFFAVVAAAAFSGAFFGVVAAAVFPGAFFAVVLRAADFFGGGVVAFTAVWFVAVRPRRGVGLSPGACTASLSHPRAMMCLST